MPGVMTPSELDQMVLLNSILFTELQPFFQHMMKFDNSRSKGGPKRSLEKSAFLGKGMQASAFATASRLRGRCESYATPQQWVDFSAAHAIVVETVNGLIDRYDKRYIPLLYFAMSAEAKNALAWRVAMQFVNHMAHPDGVKILKQYGFMHGGDPKKVGVKASTAEEIPAKTKGGDEAKKEEWRPESLRREAEQQGEDGEKKESKEEEEEGSQAKNEGNNNDNREDASQANKEEAQAGKEGARQQNQNQEGNQAKSKENNEEKKQEDGWYQIDDLMEFREFGGRKYYLVQWTDGIEGTWELEENIPGWDDVKATLRNFALKRKDIQARASARKVLCSEYLDP